jgi:hypothetical protein
MYCVREQEADELLHEQQLVGYLAASVQAVHYRDVFRVRKVIETYRGLVVWIRGTCTDVTPTAGAHWPYMALEAVAIDNTVSIVGGCDG